MAGPFTPLQVVELLGSVVALLLAAYAWRNRRESGAKPLAVITVGAAIWMVTDAFRGIAGDASSVTPLTVVFFGGVGLTVAGWGAFALEFSGYRSHLRRRTAALLAVEPVALVLAVATNPVHNAFYVYEPTGELVGLGPLYWTHTLYSYVVVVGGLVLVASMLWRQQTLYPGQVYLVLLGASLPWLADLLVAVDLLQVSLHGVAMAGACLCLTVGLFRHKLMRLAPAAQGTLLENLRDGVFVLDREGQFADVNPTARRVLGHDDLVGKPARTHLQRHPAFEAHFDRILAATDEETFEIGVDDRFFDVRVTPLFDHRDELIGRQVQLHDVTEQRRRERELERQNERLDRFASVLSHDLRNPLSVATGRAELALETGDVSHVENVATALDRMEGIIDEVLTLAREGEGVESPEPVRLDTVAEAAWASVETRDATLSVVDDTRLTAERERLVRLLENLFRNALDHGGPAVTVTVGATPDGFYVADDGPGIPPEDRDRVLEYGYSTADEGTGFGLSIVSSIAEAHGWSVTVAESDDGGARFEFGGAETPTGTPTAEATGG